MAAGRKLSKQVPFSTLSLGKTEKLLGRAVNLSVEIDGGPDGSGVDGDTDEDAYHAKQQQRQLLLKQAASFLDFERFFAALHAIEVWRDLALQAEK